MGMFQKDRSFTGNLGFPRIGKQRELKKMTEAYWKAAISKEEFIDATREIRSSNWKLQKDKIDFIPSNDFSLYDQILDMSCLLGVIPERFGWNGENVDIDLMFRMARGVGRSGANDPSVPACEMTKWFDTNYHFIVPEFRKDTPFKIASDKIFSEFVEAKDAGVMTRPVLIGPITYLSLGKTEAGTEAFDAFELIDRLWPVYIDIFKRLKASGAEWVQIDEPVFSLDLPERIRTVAKQTYQKIAGSNPGLKVLIANYFGPLEDNMQTFFSLPAEAFHIDAVRGGHEIPRIPDLLPDHALLSVGIVNGRNIWVNDFDKSLQLLQSIVNRIGPDRVIISPSCSMMHVPVTVESETKLDPEIKQWLAFAEEKLHEVDCIRQALNGSDISEELSQNKKVNESRRESQKVHDANLKKKMKSVKESDMLRNASYPKRSETQQKVLRLPLFPTTTIGSFPQTAEVRSARLKYKKGEWTQDQYDQFIESEIEKTIRFQEEIDLNVLVHGEFERTDMVEYFAEQLTGYAFTQAGWVQSFGSRYVRPPVIYGDVTRPKPMTVGWTTYAQSLTRKPVKGMLTGPVTMLQWSFVRDDQPRSETCKQIALSIRDEVADLEEAGIRAIQIDEPAIREGLPLRKKDWPAYLKWAVENYRLATCVVQNETQIHTHMCYSEFKDIMQAIADMDTDVISIEASRSNMDLLDIFKEFEYPSEVGPGLYDIHSPRIPDTDEMVRLIQRAVIVVPKERIWINPDCGLKTRRWDEVIPALKHMAEAAKIMRREFGAS